MIIFLLRLACIVCKYATQSKGNWQNSPRSYEAPGRASPPPRPSIRRLSCSAVVCTSRRTSVLAALEGFSRTSGMTSSFWNWLRSTQFCCVNFSKIGLKSVPHFPWVYLSVHLGLLRSAIWSQFHMAASFIRDVILACAAKTQIQCLLQRDKWLTTNIRYGWNSILNSESVASLFCV